jgi:spermidine synthase
VARLRVAGTNIAAMNNEIAVAYNIKTITYLQDFALTQGGLVAWFFVFFFVSGFCSILYELVWLRLAMANFGVTTALVSIVLSIFMAGVGLGSWLSGRLLRRREWDGNVSLRVYAFTELLIGASAWLAPRELFFGRGLLQQFELSSSFSYYLASGAWLALTLIPWCACMGATIPIGMQAIRCRYRDESARSFSFLYLANVLGAVAGATIPLLLIEGYGFHGALRVGATLNLAIAISAAALSFSSASKAATPSISASSAASPASPRRDPKLLFLLFTTGLTSMGMEIVWIREFTPYLTTVVYAFASILGTYLLSTFIGSRIYRRWSVSRMDVSNAVWMLLGVFALFPLISASPKIHLWDAVRLVLGVAPFSGLLGFVTPMLVDRWSAGDPHKAGSAYAVNVLGCILGPLLAGFLLLPVFSERWVLFILALPWLVMGLLPAKPEISAAVPLGGRRIRYALAVIAVALVLLGRDYGSRFHHSHVLLRDHTATIIAAGEGMKRQLFVNGIGITVLTPATKMMAHLPLASLDHAPHSALAICFGMGTSFRSLLSWNIPVTAIELVPSVPRVFGFFHSDAPQLLSSPLAHVVIDDGRRYLERTTEQYDVITIDPPPPVEAAGSSLLYSKEFYATLKPRLRPDGILQQWLPSGDNVDHAAVARAIQESFPYVRLFWEKTGTGLGTHFIASMEPVYAWTAAELAQHMPEKASKDLIEWGPGPDAEHQFSALLANEVILQTLIAEAPGTQALEDDRPVNEYYLMRRRILPALEKYR